MNERFDNFQVKVYEALRNAIFEAVYGSQNVRSLIKIIQDHQMLDELYNYMDTVEIRHLIESLAFESMENKSLAEKAERGDPDSEEPGRLASDSQYIDGRKLTPNEKMFEEFFQAIFNEEDWLKRVKVRL
jgi:hypothetical protein